MICFFICFLSVCRVTPLNIFQMADYEEEDGEIYDSDDMDDSSWDLQAQPLKSAASGDPPLDQRSVFSELFYEFFS